MLLLAKNGLLGLAICLYLAKIFQIFASTWKKCLQLLKLQN